ncbi:MULTISPECIES: AraC family transcriptional regulator [Burkholderia]|uniref:AraC family transcriptional regulator n=1 Tax=Burkholderia aenigmatica TaxID=2015348 RepID=A0ABY6XUH2_9BURK|nr:MULTISPECIES: AraC family transcriptional regulator [Burkholderia]VWC84249.1 AraC family transcriptional regulator [Burkholderia aenigmatica]VWD52061.1 AraC family transcriptional regulator [Burkholderia aenigmatica]
MSTSVSRIAENLLQAEHLMLASEDPDAVVRGCAEALRPHQLVLRRRHGRIAARLHHLPMGPLSLSRLLYGGDVTIVPAMPEEDTFIVSIPLGGKASFSYGSSMAPLSRGCGTIVGPYHDFRLDIGASFDQLMLRLDRRRVESVCASMLGKTTFEPVHFNLSLVDLPTPWLTLIETAVGLTALANAHAHPRLFVQIEELLIETLLLAQPNNFSASINANQQRAPAAQIRRAITYMLEHLGEPVRLSEVARECNVSLRSLQLGFQRDLGVTPVQWLRTQRLERAYESLAFAAPGSTSVTDVALQCGFSHLGEFSTHFKRRYGKNPSEVLNK